MIKQERDHYLFKVKDPMSSLTHFIGFILAIIGMPILLIKAANHQNNLLSLISFAIFMGTMILLYGASTSYHSFNISPKINQILKKIDHMSIFILIAGSYTPVCIICLKDKGGLALLITIWLIAIIGIIIKYFWINCPKWFSSIIYTLMGWLCIIMIKEIIINIPLGGFIWLLIGGIFYTIGAIIYALKPKIFKNDFFGNHELFHCFVLVGSFCHFMMMFKYLVPLG